MPDAAAFFADSPARSGFLCDFGYGDRASLHLRVRRPAFAKASRVL